MMNDSCSWIYGFSTGSLTLNDILYKSQGLEWSLWFPQWKHLGILLSKQGMDHYDMEGKIDQDSEEQSAPLMILIFFCNSPAPHKVKTPEIKKCFYKSALTVY